MGGIVGINSLGLGVLGAASPGPAFPLQVAANGRYYQDRNGKPFLVHGEASWDAHINCSRADWKAYLLDRWTKGFNTLFTYAISRVAYASGSSAPWMFSLGGSAAGTSALPFTQNASGGTWDGDPTFANHDASFASASLNDSYFAQLVLFVQDAAAFGICVFLFPSYDGFGNGNHDGWWLDMTNSANTQSVCHSYGQYLANGHGTFAGFKNQPNIVWVVGGDMTPSNASEGALRQKNMIQGLQSAGDTHLVVQHWNHDASPNDQTDMSGLLTGWSIYTGDTGQVYSPAGMGRNLYSNTSTKPVSLIETTYWGDGGTARKDIRLESWHAFLSGCAGTYCLGFSPFWTFTNSVDGTVGGAITGTTSWITNTLYKTNQYRSANGNWYRCLAGGTSGPTKPSGTGTNISDGGVSWTYVAAISSTMGGMANLLSEPAILDHQSAGLILKSIAWWTLVPSGLGGQVALVSSGGGTAPTWSDGSLPSGGLDYVAASAALDGSLLVAYCPDANSGTFSIAMTVMRGTTTGTWYDPTTRATQSAGSGIANTGTHSFTRPGANAGGDNDWVLILTA